MNNGCASSLKRIGVFYDGNYFLQVSNYYNYVHPRKRRLSISGLHYYIRHLVAKEENVDIKLCKIADAHYFRCRYSAQDASQRGNQLYYDRVFDDILMSEGVITHYLPFKNNFGKKEERGIDVWLALEAFELAIYKQFDIVVLIASNGDYVPLVRKLNTLGTRVMVLGWEFEYTNDEGQKVVTKTSQDLLEEVSYPVPMHTEIDENEEDSEIVDNLFVSNESTPKPVIATNITAAAPKSKVSIASEDYQEGEILSLKNGYGFIKHPNNNLFFHYLDLQDVDFNDLMPGDPVEFTIEQNIHGQDVAKNVRKIE
ncbi:NYN domain-containing protein [Acetobacteroides hydrogenigenes]|uniref:Cold-shock-like DNA binding protein n=1 Tax=Acetobacteroides hydrogenigenes TaxID=979970 RepID=A0A4R2EFB1_9BACT|nr:NYN domain-containing protein [Acetobacteroides hydrogenigenes]TCN66667.1 cold-shock-like DNA binding protein [Acetobacteroides hydrogenigenes]